MKAAARRDLATLVSAQHDDAWRRIVDGLPSINSLRSRQPERFHVGDDIFAAAVAGLVPLAPQAERTLSELQRLFDHVSQVVPRLPDAGVGFLTAIKKKKSHGSFCVFVFGVCSPSLTLNADDDDDDDDEKKKKKKDKDDDDLEDDEATASRASETLKDCFHLTQVFLSLSFVVDLC